jgi:hypothetical protein
LYAGKESVTVGKIFVRHRRHVSQGAGRPRFAVVAAEGSNLKFFKTRVRRAELEKIAAETGAEIVYLPRGESAEVPVEEGGRGRRRRQKRDD